MQHPHNIQSLKCILPAYHSKREKCTMSADVRHSKSLPDWPEVSDRTAELSAWWTEGWKTDTLGHCALPLCYSTCHKTKQTKTLHVLRLLMICPFISSSSTSKGLHTQGVVFSTLRDTGMNQTYSLTNVWLPILHPWDLTKYSLINNFEVYNSLSH